jgi:hypothetical protein
MGRHRKTTRLIEAATEILAAHYPQTVRQVFYQLVFETSHRKHSRRLPVGLEGSRSGAA